VPYLPIDPQDLGRSYEAIIRVNSQSGKGGIAHVLRAGWGLDLPAELRAEFATVIQRVTDITGAEVEPDRIWDIFRTEYCDLAGLTAEPDGDSVTTVLSAVCDRGVPAVIDQLIEAGTGSSAVCYARLLVDHHPVWGVGLAPAPPVAAVRAALYRAGVLAGDGTPRPAGSREGAQ
jgi:2-isopropylmalate synthase